MEPRRTEIEIEYNGKNVKTTLCNYIESFSYEDAGSGEGDTLSIELENIDKRWLNDWFPIKGDTISAKINMLNWYKEKDKHTFNCGKFLLDDFSFSGRPLKCSISALSTPMDQSFKATERSKTWENVKLKDIANEIAQRASISLEYDADDIVIKTIEQSKQTDADFLSQLCEKYDLSIKIYSYKLVIYDTSKYEQKEVVRTINETEVSNWSIKSTLDGTYTGGKMQYTEGKSTKEFLCQIGSGTRILSLNEKADSKQDAEKKIRSEVNKANRQLVTGSFEIMADEKLAAGCCINLRGFGKFDGKYYINKVSHNLGSSAYTMSIDVNQVQKKL